jgi:hypothetical protein
MDNLAQQWLTDFCNKNKAQLKLLRSYLSGYHILQVDGDNPKKSLASLLQDPLLCVNRTWAVLTPYSEGLDLADPLGLNQLIYITFNAWLSWVEGGICKVVGPLG